MSVSERQLDFAPLFNFALEMFVGVFELDRPLEQPRLQFFETFPRVSFFGDARAEMRT